MKKYLSTLFAAALVFAGTAVAQYNPNPNQNQNKSKTAGSSETVRNTKVTSDSGTRSTTRDHYFGKLEAYNLGKSMTVSTPGNPEGTKTIDLTGKNLTAHVASGVKVGDWVSVTEKTDNNGHKIVTVRRSKEAARAAKTGSEANRQK